MAVGLGCCHREFSGVVVVWRWKRGKGDDEGIRRKWKRGERGGSKENKRLFFSFVTTLLDPESTSCLRVLRRRCHVLRVRTRHSSSRRSVVLWRAESRTLNFIRPTPITTALLVFPLPLSNQ